MKFIIFTITIISINANIETNKQISPSIQSWTTDFWEEIANKKIVLSCYDFDLTIARDHTGGREFKGVWDTSIPYNDHSTERGKFITLRPKFIGLIEKALELQSKGIGGQIAITSFTILTGHYGSKDSFDRMLGMFSLKPSSVVLKNSNAYGRVYSGIRNGHVVYLPIIGRLDERSLMRNKDYQIELANLFWENKKGYIVLFDDSANRFKPSIFNNILFIYDFCKECQSGGTVEDSYFSGMFDFVKNIPIT